jgi:hypothetical protein
VWHFSISSDRLHGRQILALENVLSFSVKPRHSVCNSRVKYLVFFVKFNCSQIAHAMEGVLYFVSYRSILHISSVEKYV